MDGFWSWEWPIACAVGLYWPASDSRSLSALPLVVVFGNCQLPLKMNAALSFQTAVSVNTKLTVNQLQLIKLKWVWPEHVFESSIFCVSNTFSTVTFCKVHLLAWYKSLFYDNKQHLVMNPDWQMFCTENISASGRMQFHKVLLKWISLIILGYTSSFINAAVWTLTKTWTQSTEQVLQGCTFYFDYCIKLITWKTIMIVYNITMEY